MPNTMMFYQDNYVVLTPSMEQEFLSPAELRSFLDGLLNDPKTQLSQDLLHLDRDAQIDRLINTCCSLETEDGAWQWYVVRLDRK